MTDAQHLYAGRLLPPLLPSSNSRNHSPHLSRTPSSSSRRNSSSSSSRVGARVLQAFRPSSSSSSIWGLVSILGNSRWAHNLILLR